jgi:hypothetical protein
MSNHKARIWDHRESKSLDPKLLPLDHHLDGYPIIIGRVTCPINYRVKYKLFVISQFIPSIISSTIW